MKQRGFRELRRWRFLAGTGAVRFCYPAAYAPEGLVEIGAIQRRELVGVSRTVERHSFGSNADGLDVGRGKTVETLGNFGNGKSWIERSAI